VVPPYCCVTQQQVEQREGSQDVAALRYCCAIVFLEVSEFYQLPHGAIMPQYFFISVKSIIFLHRCMYFIILNFKFVLPYVYPYLT
jgi:hypothetical protein